MTSCLSNVMVRARFVVALVTQPCACGRMRRCTSSAAIKIFLLSTLKSPSAEFLLGRQSGFGTFCGNPKPIAAIYIPERRDPAEWGTQIEIVAITRLRPLLNSCATRLWLAWSRQPVCRHNDSPFLPILFSRCLYGGLFIPVGLSTSSEHTMRFSTIREDERERLDKIHFRPSWTRR